MDTVKVIVFGVGNVGSGIIDTMRKRKGVELVGAIDIDPMKVGKDAGVVAGGTPIGVTVTDDIGAMLKRVKADVAIDVASPLGIRETFERMGWAIEKGINVVVASMETCNLWFTDKELAKEVDEKCRKYGVSYVGFGATQTEERYITSMTEGSTDVQHISFTHHADVQAFSDESNAAEWGISLTEEQYHKGIADGSVKSKEDIKAIVPYIADCFGWKLDDVQLHKKLMVNDKGIIYGLIATVEGFVNGIAKIDMNWEMLIDPNKKYYDHLVVKGTPMIDAMNVYTPDRGMAATIGAITNGIASMPKLPKGYVNSLTAPACHIIYDEYSRHV